MDRLRQAGEQTNWWVITGGPSTGKTTVLTQLAQLGYRVMPEAARVLIDEEMSKGLTIQQIRSDEAIFQRRVLALKEQAETRIPHDQLVFWDRGIYETSAYWSGIEALKNERDRPFLDDSNLITMVLRRRYKGIFLMDRLPYENDYARVEDETLATQIHRGIELTYKVLGYTVINVPVVDSVSLRANFIIDQVKKTSGVEASIKSV